MISEITVLTKDNVKICANYYKNNKKEVVIIAPGWFMTKDSNAFLEIAKIFQNDYDVLSIDFRGHGKSKGFYTFSAKEIMDIDEVVNFAKSKEYEKVYLVGFSLGGSIALIHAANKQNIDKVIAISAPSDFSKIENAMWKKEAWLETMKKFELKRYFTIRPDIIPRKKIKPIDIIEKITVPTLFIAGEKDPTVCFWHANALYKKANCKKEYKIFKNGCHAEDLFLHFKDEFSSLCLNWLKN